MLTCRLRLLVLPTLALLVPGVRADDPTDNPIARFYSGPEGYPAWTDGIHWSNVINMKSYPKGKTAYERFEKARDELAERGGVLYYPAGTYDFSTMPPGHGLMLRRGVVIRGEAPTGHPVAANGQLELPTKFVFAFRNRGGGTVPRDWNFLSLLADEGKYLRDVDQVGIAWVHLVGVTVAFGPDMEWAKTWGKAKSLLSDNVKRVWAPHEPTGTHPADALVGGGKYQGGARGRFVFGCVLEDATVLDDFLDPGYGPDGFHTQRYCARVVVYGSRVLVANNLLPRSRKNFKYLQKTTATPAGKQGTTILLDYGKTLGIDINKELLTYARNDGTCPGYFEEGVVVRDNYVFNHGHKGFNIAGNWVSITGNNNDRAFLRQGDDVYGAPFWTLTLDGWQAAGANTDNLSRAFDLAGRNLWIDGNRFNNTGSSPGNDGEGIICRPPDATQLFSWAITHNVHTRGSGVAGGMGGADADCHGLLIAWNETPGWVGNATKRKDVKMADCAFVANKCDHVVPDDKTVAGLGIRAPLTARPPGAPTSPTKVTAEVYQDDAVKVAWTGSSDNAVGFRVERRIAEGKWQPIAYRPPRPQGDSDNPPEWVDFTAPPGKELTYRVVALGTDDSDAAASAPTGAIMLRKGEVGSP
jgi:hypothetical protein